MNVTDKFPDLLGLDQNGKELRLSDFPGKRFIIYFYPKDSTSGCTFEANNFKDNYKTWLDMGYQVIGVSKDSQKSHCRFIEKNELPFPLVADTDLTLAKLAGIENEGKVERTTFVLNNDGTVTDIITKVQTRTASEQLFALLDDRYDVNPA